MTEIGGLNMSNRRLLHAAVLYNTVTLHKPAYLSNKIKFRSDIHNTNVRSASYYYLPEIVYLQYKQGL